MMKTRHDDDEDKPHVQVDRDDGIDYDHDDVNKWYVQVYRLVTVITTLNSSSHIFIKMVTILKHVSK